MWVKSEKGSIAIFVLTALLFMTAFLIISIAGNINKIKVIKEQQDIVRNTYSHNDGEEAAYERAYTALRNKNGQIMTYSITNNNTIELNKTYDAKLENYRIYGNEKSIKLPDEYQEVEYIESTGSQYINTGYKPNSNTSIEMKFTNNNTGTACLYSSRTNTTVKTYSAFIVDGNSLRIDYNGTMNSDLGNLNSDSTYVLKQEKNNIYLNNNLIRTLSSADFSTDYNMYLLNSQISGSVGVHWSKIKLYYCKIWDDGTLVRNMIPCYRKSDNEIGMYDIVNSIFYSGNNIVPDEYQEVEYIESTGSQYINTGYKPNSNTSIEMKFTNNNTGTACLYSSRTNTTVKTYSAFIIDGNSLRIDYNSTMNSDLGNLNSDSTYVLKQEKNNIYLNNNLIRTLSSADFSTDYNMYLLNSQVAGNIGKHWAKVKLYYCKIWNDGPLLRNMIPCYRKSDGEGGMYDIVNMKFYQNDGTEAFNLGQNADRTFKNKGNDVKKNYLGDLVSDSNNENYGKYKIDIRITDLGENKETIKEIYIDTQLKENDYIDYKTKTLHIFDENEKETITNIELPDILSFEDYTKIEILTREIPSKIEVEYVGYIIN